MPEPITHLTGRDSGGGTDVSEALRANGRKRVKHPRPASPRDRGSDAPKFSGGTALDGPVTNNAVRTPASKGSTQSDAGHGERKPH